MLLEDVMSPADDVSNMSQQSIHPINVVLKGSMNLAGKDSKAAMAVTQFLWRLREMFPKCAATVVHVSHHVFESAGPPLGLQEVAALLPVVVKPAFH